MAGGDCRACRSDYFGGNLGSCILATDSCRSNLVIFDYNLNLLGPESSQPWLTSASMLILILVNFFTVSVLVSVIVTEIERRLNKLRRGRSVVLETDHTAILG